MRVKVASRGIEMIFARGIRQMKREFWEVGGRNDRPRGTPLARAERDEKRDESYSWRGIVGRCGGFANNPVKFAKQYRRWFRKERVRRTLPPGGNATPRSGITASPAPPV